MTPITNAGPVPLRIHAGGRSGSSPSSADRPQVSGWPRAPAPSLIWTCSCGDWPWFMYSPCFLQGYDDEDKDTMKRVSRKGLGDHGHGAG